MYDLVLFICCFLVGVRCFKHGLLVVVVCCLMVVVCFCWSLFVVVCCLLFVVVCCSLFCFVVFGVRYLFAVGACCLFDVPM